MPLVTIDQFQIKINTLLVFFFSPFFHIPAHRKKDKCTLGFNELWAWFREASLLRNALKHVHVSQGFCKEEWT